MMRAGSADVHAGGIADRGATIGGRYLFARLECRVDE